MSSVVSERRSSSLRPRKIVRSGWPRGIFVSMSLSLLTSDVTALNRRSVWARSGAIRTGLSSSHRRHRRSPIFLNFWLNSLSRLMVAMAVGGYSVGVVPRPRPSPCRDSIVGTSSC
jgi:hypothetical protein